MPVTISLEQFRKRFTMPPTNGPVAKGHFSEFYIAADEFLKTEVILKIVDPAMDPRPKPAGCLKRRIQKMHHPNLLQEIEHLAVEGENTPGGQKGFEVHVLEYHLGGDLDHLHANPTSLAHKVRIVEGLLNGLDALHQRRIIHGNLKPRNVLIQDVGHPHVRLADFGWARKNYSRQNLLAHPGDSLAYFAPEQLDAGKVRANADFWSLGLLVYEIFLDKYVFGDNFANNTDLISRIQSADLPKDIDQIPKPYHELVRACLVRDPAQRPRKIKTLRQILAGEIVWRNGQAEKVTAPTPPDIYCYNCGTANAPATVTCTNCGKALTGPEFLKNYRRSNALGVWAVIFFTLWMLPIGFFYYGLHETAKNDGFLHIWDPPKSSDSTGIKIADRVLQAVDFWIDIKEFDDPEKKKVAQNIAVVLLIFIASYFFIIGFICFLFFYFWMLRVSNNLARLGSHKRTYHPLFLLLGGLVALLGVGAITKAGGIITIVAFMISSVLPLFILQEVWRGSNATYLVEGTGWKKSKGSFLIFSWWILSMIFPVLLILPLMAIFPSFILPMAWFYLTVGIIGAYYLIFILVIVRINYRQGMKYHAWARQGGVVSKRS